MAVLYPEVGSFSNLNGAKIIFVSRYGRAQTTVLVRNARLKATMLSISVRCFVVISVCLQLLRSSAERCHGQSAGSLPRWRPVCDDSCGPTPHSFPRCPHDSPHEGKEVVGPGHSRQATVVATIYHILPTIVYH